jgi:sialic acid synthase SpsE
MRIIAELGVNTGGSLDTALRMVEAAAEAGADGIKVQAYRPGDFLPREHKDWDMFAENRLIFSEIEEVFALARDLGLEYGGTPTSLHGVEFLAEQKVDWLKNGSDFLLRNDMIEAMLDTGIETWVSTGMATPREIENVPNGANLMLCTSLYPCPDENAHLIRLKTEMFRGYSDHTKNLNTATLCAVLGAEMYETHFTLDKTQSGPDHAFSRNPSELAIIVERVRQAGVLLGDYVYPDPAELANQKLWRVTEGTLRSG